MLQWLTRWSHEPLYRLRARNIRTEVLFDPNLATLRIYSYGKLASLTNLLQPAFLLMLHCHMEHSFVWQRKNDIFQMEDIAYNTPSSTAQLASFYGECVRHRMTNVCGECVRRLYAFFGRPSLMNKVKLALAYVAIAWQLSLLMVFTCWVSTSKTGPWVLNNVSNWNAWSDSLNWILARLFWLRIIL